MVSKFKKVILLLFSVIVFFINQNSVFANHAGAIGISEQSYSIFLYISIALGLMLLIILAIILKLSKQIKQKKRNGDSFQELIHQRKFLFFVVIMLIIGLLSMVLIYFFLMSAISNH